jgi:probable phosphoglycerate mutase
MAQAAAVQGAIADFAPDLAIHSPLMRARQTVDVVSPGGLTAQADERLREVDFGSWEGLRPAEVAAADPERLRQFDAGEIDRFPGGETSREAALRVSSAITAVLGSADRLLVVGHNTALRLGLAQLIGVDPKRYRRTFAPLRPCHWAEVEVSASSQGRLVTYNTVGPIENTVGPIER